MAKKVSGLNMLILVGGLLLLFLFFWGAYKVKDGFDSCNQTYSMSLGSKGSSTKNDSLQHIETLCSQYDGIEVKKSGCYYSKFKVSHCRSIKEPNGEWKSICTCTGTLDST